MTNVVSLDAARARRDEPWISQREVARRLGKDPRTVRRWHHMEPPVPHRRRYAAVEYRLSEVEGWLMVMGEQWRGRWVRN